MNSSTCNTLPFLFSFSDRSWLARGPWRCWMPMDFGKTGTFLACCAGWGACAYGAKHNNTERICYSVGLWFSKIYHYNRCINDYKLSTDVHSLHSNREHLFPAWAYPSKIYKIPNSMGCRVLFKHSFSLIHRSFFLLWPTDEKENLWRGKLRNVEHWLA